MKKIRSFAINGTILTICSLLMRTVSVAFNVYVAKCAGAEAMGLYSLLSSVYGFAVTLALSGINLAVTRLVSEALAVNNTEGVAATMKKAFIYASVFGILSFAMLFSLSDILAERWLFDPRAETPLKLLSFCLPAVSLSSVINGYFAAVRRVYKNALSQLIEMSVKIITTCSLFSLIFLFDAQKACILLVLGGGLGEICSFILNILMYAFDRSLHFKKKAATHKVSEGLSRRIMGISLPVAFTSYFRSALLSLEHSLIPKGLQKYGHDRSAALSSYGTLSSMALPVINFPYALIGSFSSLLIPEVAECRARGEKRHIQYIAYRTYQMGIGFAICIFGIFLTFSESLGLNLFSSSNASQFILLLAPLAPIMYTDSITDAILKGMGEQLYAMKVNIADAIISVLLVYFLVPIYGIYGYVATLYIAEIVNVSLSLSKMVKVTGHTPPLLKFLICPIISAMGACSSVNILRQLVISDRSPLGLTACIISFVFIYIIFILLLGGIRKEDLSWFKKFFSTKEI